MVHSWTKHTDGTGSTVRVVLFDYRKAFDLIDHALLARKLLALDMPVGVSFWIIDFLTDRTQRVKLGEDCLFEWRKVPAAVPQGTKLGPTGRKNGFTRVTKLQQKCSKYHICTILLKSKDWYCTRFAIRSNDGKCHICTRFTSLCKDNV